MVLLLGSFGYIYYSNSVSAATTINFSWKTTATYGCPGPCVNATTYHIDGTAGSDSPTFGTMQLTATGIVTGFTSTGCGIQAESYSFTGQGGTIFVSTTSNSFCPTSNPNVFNETGSFIILGGTGGFSGATGEGVFAWTVQITPQVGNGTITGTIKF